MKEMKAFAYSELKRNCAVVIIS